MPDMAVRGRLPDSGERLIHRKNGSGSLEAEPWNAG